MPEAQDDQTTNSISVLRRDGRAWITMVGEIDVVTVADLGPAAIKSMEGVEVWVDLSAVTFLDSSGLRLLVLLNNVVQAMHLVNTPARVARLLEVTGMTGLFADES